VFKQYQDFVLSKAAPARTLSEVEFNLGHAALGLCTEYLEYVLHTDSNNLKEELEDLLWYMIFTAYWVDVNVNNLPDRIEQAPESTFAEELEEFVSLIKKHVYYGKNMTRELTISFHSLWRVFIYTCQLHEAPIDELISANMIKLNKRYTANFTQEESVARKDKQ